MQPSGEQTRVDILPGTLEMIVLQTLTTMGPQHAYGIAARIEQVAENALRLNQGHALSRAGSPGTSANDDSRADGAPPQHSTGTGDGSRPSDGGKPGGRPRGDPLHDAAGASVCRAGSGAFGDRCLWPGGGRGVGAMAGDRGSTGCGRVAWRRPRDRHPAMCRASGRRRACCERIRQRRYGINRPEASFPRRDAEAQRKTQRSGKASRTTLRR